jgi:hypothetical protein
MFYDFYDAYHTIRHTG